MRGKRIGEAAHPGPGSPGERERIAHAARVAARVQEIDETIAGLGETYQALQAERMGLVGTYLPWTPTPLPRRRGCGGDGFQRAWPCRGLPG